MDIDTFLIFLLIGMIAGRLTGCGCCATFNHVTFSPMFFVVD